MTANITQTFIKQINFIEVLRKQAILGYNAGQIAATKREFFRKIASAKYIMLIFCSALTVAII